MKRYDQPSLLLIDYINSLLTPEDRVLDIGCGTKEIAESLKCFKVTTLDIWKPFSPDIWCDLTTIPILPCEENSYDIILLIDIIEHLPKDKGFKILRETKRVCSKYIIILTPMWWDENLESTNDPKSPYYKNEYNKHLSLWTKEDLVDFEEIKSIKLLKKYFLGLWRKPNAIK